MKKRTGTNGKNSRKNKLEDTKEDTEYLSLKMERKKLLQEIVRIYRPMAKSKQCKNPNVKCNMVMDIKASECPYCSYPM